MRNVFVLLLALLLSCSLFSCGKGELSDLSGVGLPEKAEIQIITEESQLSASFELLAETGGKYEVHSPDSLAGMVFCFENGECSVSEGSFTLPGTKEFMPDRGQLLRAWQVLRSDTEPLKSTKTEGKEKYTVYTYVEEDYNYLFYCLDGKTVKLEVEGVFPVTILFG